MDTERLDKPSASGAPRLYNCPGSFALEQKCPPDEDTEESSRGTKIHDYLAGAIPLEDLSLDEQDTAGMCQRLEEEALQAWSVMPQQCIREDRLYLRDRLRIIFSGKPDVVYFDGVRALALDYKTGFGDQDDSADNEQLRALAVLVKNERLHLKEITVAILQPVAGMKVQLATFNEEALAAAEEELRMALDAAKQPDAPLHLGDHCKWCRAKAICPKQQGQLTTLSQMDIRKYDERAEMLDNDRLAELYGMKGNVMKLLGDLEAELKRRVERGDIITTKDGEQYALVDGAAKRKVKDNAKLQYELSAEPFFISAAEILACSTVRVGDLDALMRTKSKMTAVKVKEWQAENLPNIITKEPGGKTLEKVALLKA